MQAGEQRRERGEERVARGGVQPGRRLVEDEHGRVGEQVRARASRRRWPPDSRRPRWPSRVSNPSGSARMNASAPAARGGRAHSAPVALRARVARSFSRTLDVAAAASPGPRARRSPRTLDERQLAQVVPIEAAPRPSAGRRSRTSSRATVDFPAPLGPVSATVRPGSIARSRPRSASRAAPGSGTRRRAARSRRARGPARPRPGRSVTAGRSSSSSSTRSAPAAAANIAVGEPGEVARGPVELGQVGEEHEQPAERELPLRERPRAEPDDHEDAGAARSGRRRREQPADPGGRELGLDDLLALGRGSARPRRARGRAPARARRCPATPRRRRRASRSAAASPARRAWSSREKCRAARKNSGATTSETSASRHVEQERARRRRRACAARRRARRRSRRARSLDRLDVAT